MSRKPVLAFIGVGNMGNPMALNLVKAGYDVTVFDIDLGKTHNLQAAGAKVAHSLQAAVKNAEVVMVSLPGPPQVAQVMLGDDGVLAHLKPGVTVIDTTTSSVELIQQLVDISIQKQIDYLEAPVTNASWFSSMFKPS